MKYLSIVGVCAFVFMVGLCSYGWLNQAEYDWQRMDYVPEIIYEDTILDFTITNESSETVIIDIDRDIKEPQ